MDKEKIKDFLKGYAEILKEGVDISSDLPLSMNVKMAGGCIIISTKDGRHIATISVEKGGQSPSMPISPVDITYAKLIVKLLNNYYHYNGDENGNRKTD